MLFLFLKIIRLFLVRMDFVLLARLVAPELAEGFYRRAGQVVNKIFAKNSAFGRNLARTDVNPSAPLRTGEPCYIYKAP